MWWIVLLFPLAFTPIGLTVLTVALVLWMIARGNLGWVLVIVLIIVALIDTPQ